MSKGTNATDTNQTLASKPTYFNTIISHEDSEIFMALNCVVLSSLVSMFGIGTNVINMIVFYKQGLDTSINITFFALAISDLFALTLQQIFNVFMNPWFEKADVPMVPAEVQYLTSGIPRAVFTRITCLITVYITMERCMCIIFPLRVKQMITPRRTAIAMVVFYIITFLTFVPLYCTASIGWKFYPHRNKTLLGLVFTPNNDAVTQINYIILTLMELALFAGVVIFTAILIRKLKQKSKWRKTANADQATSETMSSRDRRTSSMVVLIASVLIACNTPIAALCLVTFFEPEFTIGGRYHSLQLVMFSFGFLFETVNSSVNIFLYIKMSTKYREIFWSLFSCKQKVVSL